MDSKSRTEHLKKTAGNTLQSLRDTTEEIQNRLGEIWETSRERAASCARATNRAIHEKPYQTLGIAFGVGMLFGLFLTRRVRRRYLED
jgi:ElaB/YqjD/DUF883 family membrane-anchored ribosome-binding protein